jgi:glycosyltransferase involved in cell wall biosynthesis
MKVLIVHAVYKFVGGEETVVSEEVKLLQSKGMDVEVIWFSNDRHTLLKLLLLPFNIFSYFKMRKKLREFRPDIVHIHNLHFAASPSVLYAIKKEQVPVVMTLHNFRIICPSGMLYANGKLFLHSLRGNFPLKAVMDGVYKNRLVTFWLALSMQLHKWMQTWKIVNRFIVLTEHAKGILLSSPLRVAARQVVVKPNFSSYSNTAVSEKQSYFLYVGRLSEEKGIQVLLKAFSLVNFPLKIAGDGPLKKEVLDAAAAHPNIEFLGKRNKEEIAGLMSNCSALVFTSIWYEGMPLTIIESFASGAPVIASRLGAMESMITHGYNGLHFEVGNPLALSAALARWMQFSEQEKNEYRRKARLTYTQVYTPEENAVRLLSIYRSVTKPNPYKNKLRYAALSQLNDS